MRNHRKMHFSGDQLRPGRALTLCGSGRGMNCNRVLTISRIRSMVNCLNCLKTLSMIDKRPIVKGTQGELGIGGELA